MATSTRFYDLDESELENLLDSRDSENTKKLIRASLSVLENYATEKGMDLSEIERQPTDQMTCFLRKFYAEMKKVDAERYAKKYMISLQYGLLKHFLKVRKEDIINDERFKTANEMFKAVLVKLKKFCTGEPKSKEPLTQEDRNTLHETVFSLENPENLPFRQGGESVEDEATRENNANGPHSISGSRERTSNGK